MSSFDVHAAKFYDVCRPAGHIRHVETGRTNGVNSVSVIDVTLVSMCLSRGHQ